jgi:NAD(P)-dependent dehydrogenase (short-subunit alcohol dehydrogenase family)
MRTLRWRHDSTSSIVSTRGGTMLKGKRIVILGGSAGIGLAVAELAAREGAHVVIGSSTRARVDSALARLPGAEGHVVDLREESAVRGLFESIGRLDHLVYTAGEELLIAPLAQLDLVKARQFFELRYWGALAAIKAAAPRLARDGSIVLTSGAAGHRPHPGFVIGGSICAAMEAVARALAIELAPIRVNVVTPGFVDTGLWSNVPEEARHQMFRDAAARLPVGHVAQPAEIAEHYLGFMRGRYVTGQSLLVDGGGVLV